VNCSRGVQPTLRQEYPASTASSQQYAIYSKKSRLKHPSPLRHLLKQHCRVKNPMPSRSCRGFRENCFSWFDSPAAENRRKTAGNQSEQL